MRFFFPPKCIVCDEVLEHFAKTPYCSKCECELEDAKIYSHVEKPIPFVDMLFVFYQYENESVKYSVFHAKKCFSKPFEEFYKSACIRLLEKTKFTRNIDTITFATRRSSERRAEGFDQAEKMAKVLSIATGIPCKKVLRRVRKSQKQRNLAPHERMKNVKRLFECTGDMTGKRVLLVDDVVTTGSTVSNCAKALKEKGAAEVRVLTFSL